jgi:glycolate oxidase
LLERSLGPSKVRSEKSQCEPFATDESDTPGQVPDAVVLAESEDDIVRTLEVADATGVPVTPRLGGTGRTGGAIPVAGGIVLAALGMHAIKEIDRAERLAVVEPGVITADLQYAVEREGLFFPPDPSSLKDCTIGGNVAANAGGPRAFKYGVTRNYVLGLQAVLVGGTSLRIGRRTAKGVTGYDLTALLTGSEGTLAVFSEVTLRLISKPPEVVTLMVLFDNARVAALAVSSIVALGLGPRCIELLDRGTLDAMRARSVDIDQRAGAMLIIEVDGDGAECETGAERIGQACTDAKAIEILVAQNEAQRSRVWHARQELSPSVRALSRRKISEDVVVPRQRIADLLDEVQKTAEQTGVRTVSYGHAGDGNLHVNFLWDDDEDLPKVRQSVEQLFRNVVRMRGTLSGEHGIGILKMPYLGLEQSDDLIALQRRLKHAFDPKGLMNPGKILPAPSRGACEGRPAWS